MSRRRNKKNNISPLTMNNATKDVYKLGVVVVVTSERSMHKGEGGFVYKQHQTSGRLGILFAGGKKVSYTVAGLRKATPAELETLRFSKVVDSRNKHFGSPQEEEWMPVSADEEEEDSPEPPVSSPSSSPPKGGSREKSSGRDEQMFLAIQQLHQMVQSFKSDTETSYTLMGECVAALSSRLESVEKALSKGQAVPAGISITGGDDLSPMSK